MTTSQIIEIIWEWPWYKVLYLAIFDDIILFWKLWWLWIVIIGIVLLWTIVFKRG